MPASNPMRLERITSEDNDSSQMDELMDSDLQSVSANATNFLDTGLALEFLGTSSAVSTAERNVSSLALHHRIH